MEFADQWLWLIFIVVGLLLATLELLGGVVTELDMVFVGSAFGLGGLIGWPFGSWPPVVIATGVICLAYVAAGRRYVKRWVQVRETKTNVDAIVGSQGIVLTSIRRSAPGRVRIGGQEWRATADGDIEEGAEIVVTAIRGVTVVVSGVQGGNGE
jgi:membrane protein implicated in regulation of membrane protease activity